eukprot:scaffold10715_cov114-Isochrysis_galbana.AAC.20
MWNKPTKGKSRGRHGCVEQREGAARGTSARTARAGPRSRATVSSAQKSREVFLMSDTTVYVGGLSKGTDQEALVHAFAPQRVVRAVFSRSFGFITFATAGEAADAVARSDVIVGGRLVHAALRHSSSMAVDAHVGAVSGRSASTGGGRSVFVHRLARATDALQAHTELADACLAVGVAARVVVPRKQGQPPQHRGFAFLDCAQAGDVSTLLAGLQAAGWSVERVRRKRGKADRRGRRGRRGARHGRLSGAAGSSPIPPAAGDESSEGEGEEQDDGVLGDGQGEASSPAPRDASAAAATCGDAVAPARTRGAAGAIPHSGSVSALSDAELRALLVEVREASEGWGDATDPVVAALASFVSESREWALGVQGFLVEHCRSFEDTDENRLEWHDLHRRLGCRMEAMLEIELAKLGVTPDDFVERMRAAGGGGGGAAGELLEAVLAMDDFRAFKSQMLRLKAEVGRMSLDEHTLDTFASPVLGVM